MWFLLRIIIGSIFIASGLGKLLSPYQNFLYVIQAYQLLPSNLEFLVAQIFPWIEFLTGLFVFLGLWTALSIRAASVLFGIFVVVVGQALIRNLPLENCGCFGEWIHLKPKTVIILDSISLWVTWAMLARFSAVKKFSLDSYFDPTLER